jgi:hypothetical protein
MTEFIGKLVIYKVELEVAAIIIGLALSIFLHPFLKSDKDSLGCCITLLSLPILAWAAVWLWPF